LLKANTPADIDSGLLIINGARKIVRPTTSTTCGGGSQLFDMDLWLCLFVFFLKKK
jgi:hypothetical protein